MTVAPRFFTDEEPGAARKEKSVAPGDRGDETRSMMILPELMIFTDLRESRRVLYDGPQQVDMGLKYESVMFEEFASEQVRCIDDSLFTNNISVAA